MLKFLPCFSYILSSFRKIASDSRLCRVYFALGPGNEAHSEARVFELIYPRGRGRESNGPGQCFNDGNETRQDENYATLLKGEVCAKSVIS